MSSTYIRGCLDLFAIFLSIVGILGVNLVEGSFVDRRCLLMSGVGCQTFKFCFRKSWHIDV